jgi:hypothetical protein
MGQKLREDELDNLTEMMIGYDCCQLCMGVEESGNQKEVFEDSGVNICDECLEDLPNFIDWIEDGNVIQIDNYTYTTQDAQYHNRLKGIEGLVEYFKKEFLND